METVEKKINVISISEKSDNRQNGSDVDTDLLMDFVSLMVHDLQAPLASMKTLLRFLKEGKFDPAKKTHVDLVRSTAIALERSESIIYDLFDAAKAEKAGIPFKFENDNIIEIIENSVEMINSCALEYGITIQKRLPHSEVIVKIDRNLLLRVMDNLLFNAFKNSPYGSKVYVDAELTDQKVVVAVTDEGPGFVDIDPEVLFEKYKQMELRKENKYKGVGLGLYFCRLAVNAMNGRIWAEQHSNGGACFKFTLNL